jgi:hypothetical protein
VGVAVLLVVVWQPPSGQIAQAKRGRPMLKSNLSRPARPATLIQDCRGVIRASLINHSHLVNPSSRQLSQSPTGFDGISRLPSPPKF